MAGSEPSKPAGRSERGVAEALREAVEATMSATSGSAGSTRERAGELVDEVVRRGREARGELARRGQEAGAGLARRGQEASAGLARRGHGAADEVGRRLEVVEGRLAELERRLVGAPEGEPGSSSSGSTEPDAKAEG